MVTLISSCGRGSEPNGRCKPCSLIVKVGVEQGVVIKEGSSRDINKFSREILGFLLKEPIEACPRCSDAVTQDL